MIRRFKKGDIVELSGEYKSRFPYTKEKQCVKDIYRENLKGTVKFVHSVSDAVDPKHNHYCEIIFENGHIMRLNAGWLKLVKKNSSLYNQFLNLIHSNILKNHNRGKNGSA